MSTGWVTFRKSGDFTNESRRTGCLSGSLEGISKHEAIIRLKMWFEKFEIEAWWDKKVEELSKGMAQKVQFITTVLHEPELLIFDEPFSGFGQSTLNY